jgi:hypothetical protein
MSTCLSVIGDGNPDNNPELDANHPADEKAVAPAGGGPKKKISDMTPAEFNKLSKEQAEAAGWRAEKWVNEDGSQASAATAWGVLWIGPNGQENMVPIDDAAERLSDGLEWQD